MQFVIPKSPKVERKENDKTEITVAEQRVTYTEDEVRALLERAGKESKDGK